VRNFLDKVIFDLCNIISFYIKLNEKGKCSAFSISVSLIFYDATLHFANLRLNFFFFVILKITTNSSCETLNVASCETLFSSLEMLSLVFIISLLLRIVEYNKRLFASTPFYCYSDSFSHNFRHVHSKKVS